jgi:protein SCO1/2
MRPMRFSRILALLVSLGGMLHAQATGGRWPAPTPPGQPPVFAAPADAPPPAPTLERDEALRISQAAIGRVLGEHALRDRAGAPVRLADYHRGKPLLVSFVYTGCFQVCPTGTRALQAALEGLEKVFTPEQFNVVSIGFNPPADSPQAMRAFAAQHRIDASNWDFLSASAANVDALTRDLGFSHRATPGGYDHVVGVTVVDAQGRVHAQVYGDQLTPAQVGEPLRELLRGAPVDARAGWRDLVERVRIVCTVYDPQTGTYRYAWGLILEIAGGLTFAVVMGLFFAAEARKRRRERLA